MKKELETKLLSTQKARERVLDSLQQDITRRATEIQILKKPDEAKYKEFNAKREELNRLEERMEADTRAQMGEYKAQIGKQLNQYIKDFGNKNGYDFILGKDESFNVPFAKENRNITADVKKYVNEVYGGGK
jgi:outer membrane protein